MKLKRFTVPLFDTKVLVLIGDQAEAVKICFDKYSAKIEPTVGSYGWTGYYEGFGAIMWLSEIKLEYICHEAFHCTGEVLRHKKIEHTENTEELYAYTIGFIGKEIGKLIENNNGTKK